MHGLAGFATMFGLSLATLLAAYKLGPASEKELELPTNYKDFQQQARVVGDYSLNHGWYTFSMLWLTQTFWRAFGIPGIRSLRTVSTVFFGVFPALCMAVTANLVGSYLAYGLSEAFLVDYIQSAFPDRVAYLKDRTQRYGEDLFFFMMSLMMTPGFTLTFASFASPAIGVPIDTFLAASAIGTLPSVISACLAGNVLRTIEKPDFFSFINFLQMFCVAILALLPKLTDFYLTRSHPDTTVLYRPRASYKVKNLEEMDGVIFWFMGLFLSTAIVATVFRNAPPFDQADELTLFPTSIDTLKVQAKLVSNYVKTNEMHSMWLMFVVLVYIKAFTIPGTKSLRILSGALFGWKKGMLLNISATFAGSFCSYEVANFCLRRHLEKHYPEALEKFRKKVAARKNTLFWYMLSLILMPFIPNTFIVAASPVVGVPIGTVLLATFIGTIPTIHVEVSAGEILNSLQSKNIVPLKLLLELMIIALIVVLPAIYLDDVSEEEISRKEMEDAEKRSREARILHFYEKYCLRQTD
ncbi:unnamed protein product [Notodromas monacha]|uniref:VTT domain-containing protein n=1 Tax=Notodromas monacha TaxID=399045 RepID=A0A7R9BJI1_9CRUS|nr:unnamed protein product [Notodromas monacha]CAG0915290.1 unnamed protein product [Notodromas monacha]